MTRSPKQLNDPNLLEAALEGLLLQKQRIDSQIHEVRSLLGKRKNGSYSTAAAPVATAMRKRELSASARRRIAAAQKKRWAEYRKARASSE